LDGKAVKDIKNVRAGDLLETIVYEGKIASRVDRVTK